METLKFDCLPAFIPEGNYKSKFSATIYIDVERKRSFWQRLRGDPIIEDKYIWSGFGYPPSNPSHLEKGWIKLHKGNLKKEASVEKK